METFDTVEFIGNTLWFVMEAGLFMVVFGLVAAIIRNIFFSNIYIPQKWADIGFWTLSFIGSLLGFWLTFDIQASIYTFFTDEPVDVFNYSMYSIIGTAIMVLISFIYSIKYIPICPKCGKWYDATLLSVDRDTYLKEMDVQRNVYNNSGKKIGHFNDTKLSLGTQQTGYYKCNRCGKEYVHVARY